MKSEKFKSYEIATLGFELAGDEEIRENIMYRYQKMKTRKELLIDYWNKMNNILKTKNPTLLFGL